MSEVKVASWLVVLEQENDGCDEGSNGQFLEVECHDGGGGPFYTLKTERWAFDTVEELIEQVRKAFPTQPPEQRAPSESK